MVYWLEESYRIPAPEAYMLLGQIAEARCTQMVIQSSLMFVRLINVICKLSELSENTGIARSSLPTVVSFKSIAHFCRRRA